MVIHRGSRWILTPTYTKQLPERGEAKDEESDEESNSESFLPSATLSVGPSI